MPRARSISVLLWVALSLLGSAAAAQVGAGDIHQPRVPDVNAPGAGAAGAASDLSTLTRLARPGPGRPRVHESVPPAVRFRLDEAYLLALNAVRRRATCGALFDRFAARGDEMLARTIYIGGGEVGACLRQAPAFTCVGCTWTMLCPTFARLEPPAGAAILIHEALHFAGLKERPAYPAEMNAGEITGMVRVGCSL